VNIFGKICQYFVMNKKLSLLIFFGIIFWGVLSFIMTPKQYNPEITAPSFNMTVDFPGATAREVYEMVTRPAEDVIQQIPGVDEIYSQSYHGGRSIITVLFHVGENFDESKIRLRQRISSNLDLQPMGVDNILIESIDPDDLAIMTIGLFSNNLDPVSLRKRALKIRNKLKLIPGASIVKVLGGRKREYHIVLDPTKLRETKTSVGDVESALSRSSLLSVLGSVKGPEQFQTVETTGTVKDVEDIENLVVASNVEQSLAVGDLGEVVAGTMEDDSYINYYDGDQEVDHAVLITVAKKKGENISNVSRAIHSEIEKLEKKSPLLDDVKIKILRDEGRVATEEIRGLTFNLVQAICIVFAVLFAFLNVRAAIMVAITVPLTLLTVFGIGHLAGYTINRITLFALILSLGLLVDSATVVVENIVRNKREHPEWMNLKIINTSVSEVGMGLLLSTLTTVLAFIPMGFVTGMMGPYMGPLPFFVSAAIIVSLIYSYTIVPWMASIFCKEGVPYEEKGSFLKKIYDAFIGRYTKFISEMLDSKRKRRIMMGVSAFLVIIVLLFPVVKLLRFRMLPKADREQMYVYLDMDLGRSIGRTYEMSGMLSRKLAQLPDVKSVQAFVGESQVLDFNGMFRGAANRVGTHQATLKINLFHPDDRKDMSEDIALRLREQISEWLKGYPEVKYQVVEDPPGPPVRATFFAKIKGSDEGLVKRVTRDLEGIAGDIQALEDIDTSIPEELTKYTLRVDTGKAAKARVSTASIAKTLEVLYRGGVIGVYHNDENLEQETIVLKIPYSKRDDIEDLSEIMVINDVGNPLPVNDFLYTEEVPHSDVILADNREEVVYLSGEMGARSVTYAAIDFMKGLHSYLPKGGAERTDFSLLEARYEMPDGNWVNVEMEGEWLMTLEVFRDLGLAMGIAIILIYIVLVAKFHSYVIPLLISATIPLALVGVFPGFAFLFLMGRVYFSATSMIGVIALAGIVVNNAIILLEYIMIRLEGGVDLKEAIVSACNVRLRPIVLTSLTTVLGSLAIAGDPVWSGLAWSIAFGLSLSAILTLVVFPTLVFHFFENRRLLPESVSC
jgi:multidrug efflux pump subunit AcrB